MQRLWLCRLFGLFGLCRLVCLLWVGEVRAETFVTDLVKDGGEMLEPEPEREGPPLPLTPSRVCERLARVRCNAIWGCCGAYRLAYETIQSCFLQEQIRCLGTTYEREVRAFGKNQIVLSEERLQTCETQWSGVREGCLVEADITESAACRGIFSERALVGEICRSEYVGIGCAGGMGRCVTELGKVFCRAFSPKDGSCEEIPCEAGLVCAGEAGARWCRTPLLEGEACQLSSQCKEGLRCLAGRCALPKAGGESCVALGDCADGWVCEVSSRFCIRRKGLEASCRYSQECSVGLMCVGQQMKMLCMPPSLKEGYCLDRLDCAAGLRCVEGRCLDFPDSGELCRLGEGCKEGFVCDEGLWRCLALPRIGEPCRLLEPRCEKDLGCFSSQGKAVCGKRLGQGESCAEDSQCAEGWVCRSGRCSGLPEVGEPCHKGRCSSRLSFCDTERGICRVYRSIGETCAEDAECSPQQECAAMGSSVKTCVDLPKDGQPCQGRCAGETVCKPFTSDGRCFPALCRDILRCKDVFCQPDQEHTPPEQPRPDGSLPDGTISDGGAEGPISDQIISDSPTSKEEPSLPEGGRPESYPVGGCACSGEDVGEEWFLGGLLFFLLSLWRRRA